MAYTDYEFYIESYKPVEPMSEAEFAAYAERASDYLDMITSDRIQAALMAGEEAFARKVSKAVCGIAEASKKWANGGTVTSMSFNTDGYSESKSFAAGVTNTKSEEQELYDIARQYLGGTGLLSRVIGGECRCR